MERDAGRARGDGSRSCSGGHVAIRVRALATWTNLWSAAFFVTLVLVRFTPPRAERSIKLDASWKQALTCFHSHGFQAGVDYVFTYGPLAHFEIGTYSEDQFWVQVLDWQLGFGSLVALLLVGLARRIPTGLGRGLFTLLCLMAAQVSESWWSLVIAGVCAWLLDDARRSRVRLALGFTVLALVSLVKFPYFLLAALGAIALAIVWTIARGKLAGPLVLAGFVASIAAAWLGAGQRLSALPAYLATSQEQARGYAQAMHWPATVLVLSLALGAFEREQARALAENPTQPELPRCATLVGSEPIDFFGVYQALLERRFDPRRVAADRAPQDFEIVFHCKTPTTLLLQTLPRASDVPPDAFYWSGLRIEPASATGGSGG